jgi:hypothetical protein
LWHYLTFCGDLLAVLGKLAACFAEAVTDRSVLDSINEIEMLCTALSRKIWHKMSIVKPPGAEGAGWQSASSENSLAAPSSSVHRNAI